MHHYPPSQACNKRCHASNSTNTTETWQLSAPYTKSLCSSTFRAYSRITQTASSHTAIQAAEREHVRQWRGIAIERKITAAAAVASLDSIRVGWPADVIFFRIFIRCAPCLHGTVARHVWECRQRRTKISPPGVISIFCTRRNNRRKRLQWLLIRRK